jgi:hypothetical protein
MATAKRSTTMRAVQVPAAGADFQIVEREIPEPGAGHVRIKVQAYARMMSGKAEFRVVLTM